MADSRRILAKLEAEAERLAARMLRDSTRSLVEITREAMRQAGKPTAILPDQPFATLAETLAKGKLDMFGEALATAGGEFELPRAANMAANELRTLKLFAESQEAIGQARSHLLDTLGHAMTDSLTRGDHVAAGKAAIAEAIGAAGFDAQEPHVVEAIYRSATMEANTAARIHATRDNPLVAEQLWGWEYTAVGDERTRPEHMAMNGTRLPKDHPFWKTNMPPNGWNCRCTVLEIYMDEAPDKVTEPRDFVNVEGERVAVKADEGWEYNPADSGAYRELFDLARLGTR